MSEQANTSNYFTPRSSTTPNTTNTTPTKQQQHDSNTQHSHDNSLNNNSDNITYNQSNNKQNLTVNTGSYKNSNFAALGNNATNNTNPSSPIDGFQTASYSQARHHEHNNSATFHMDELLHLKDTDTQSLSPNVGAQVHKKQKKRLVIAMVGLPARYLIQIHKYATVTTTYINQYVQ